MSTFKAGAITFLVIAALWLAAPRPFDTLDAAPIPPPAPLADGVEKQMPRVVQYEPAEGGAGRRNLFSYVIPGPPVVIVASAPVASAPVAPPLVVDDRPAPEPPPRFTYRFIGRFGRDHDPLVAFAANGDVVTVRRGDRIGGGFTLQSVGVESVDVVDEKGRVVRVRLGE